MMIRHEARAVLARLLGLGLLLALSHAAIAAEDDEAWIERYMQARQPQQSIRSGMSAAPAKIIAPTQLGSYVGRNVRLEMAAGGVRHGTVEAVSAGKLSLRAKLHGGYASYALALNSIARAELE